MTAIASLRTNVPQEPTLFCRGPVAASLGFSAPQEDLGFFVIEEVQTGQSFVLSALHLLAVFGVVAAEGDVL